MGGLWHKRDLVLDHEPLWQHPLSGPKPEYATTEVVEGGNALRSLDSLATFGVACHRLPIAAEPGRLNRDVTVLLARITPVRMAKSSPTPWKAGLGVSCLSKSFQHKRQKDIVQCRTLTALQSEMHKSSPNLYRIYRTIMMEM